MFQNSHPNHALLGKYPLLLSTIVLVLILPSWICTSKLRTVYLLAVAMCVLVTLLRNAFLAFEQCLEQLTGGGSRRSAGLCARFLPP